jgi:hypothetical protein
MSTTHAHPSLSGPEGMGRVTESSDWCDDFLAFLMTLGFP